MQAETEGRQTPVTRGRMINFPERREGTHPLQSPHPPLGWPSAYFMHALTLHTANLISTGFHYAFRLLAAGLIRTGDSPLGDFCADNPPPSMFHLFIVTPCTVRSCSSTESRGRCEERGISCDVWYENEYISLLGVIGFEELRNLSVAKRNYSALRSG